MPQGMTPAQQYWLPGYGLSRPIVLRQIQYFLGPTATVRPYSFQGREGYLIVGRPLTREQIQDLLLQSKEYEKQQTMRMRAKRVGSSSEDQSEEDINTIISVNADRKIRQESPSIRRGYR